MSLSVRFVTGNFSELRSRKEMIFCQHHVKELFFQTYLVESSDLFIISREPCSVLVSRLDCGDVFIGITQEVRRRLPVPRDP